MSASHAPALDAIALQLAAALDKYEREVDAMVGSWLEMERYAEVSADIEQIRMYASALPQLSVFWVELLIAHAELVHCLWRSKFDAPEERPELAAVQKRHGSCVASLRRRCLHLLDQGTTGAGAA